MKILCIGDVFGIEAVDRLSKLLPAYKRECGIDFCIVNGENSDGASGCEADSIRAILGAGADVVTGGNHTLRYRSMKEMLDEYDRVLRPANFSENAHGSGYTIQTAFDGTRVLTVNLIGEIGLKNLSAISPFKKLDNILSFEEGNYDIAIVDFHAEATSEKAALGYMFSDKVGAVFGTHTHVPTADASIIGGRCGFITDVGMSGPKNSIIGVKIEHVLSLFCEGKTHGFATGDGEIIIRGIIFEFDSDRKCTLARRVEF